MKPILDICQKQGCTYVYWIQFRVWQHYDTGFQLQTIYKYELIVTNCNKKSFLWLWYNRHQITTSKEHNLFLLRPIITCSIFNSKSPLSSCYLYHARHNIKKFWRSFHVCSKRLKRYQDTPTHNFLYFLPLHIQHLLTLKWIKSYRI